MLVHQRVLTDHQRLGRFRSLKKTDVCCHYNGRCRIVDHNSATLQFKTPIPCHILVCTEEMPEKCQPLIMDDAERVDSLYGILASVRS